MHIFDIHSSFFISAYNYFLTNFDAECVTFFQPVHSNNPFDGSLLNSNASRTEIPFIRLPVYVSRAQLVPVLVSFHKVHYCSLVYLGL